MEGSAMKWMAFLLVLFAASACVAQQMDEKQDPAMQVTLFTPHRVSISNGDEVKTSWLIQPAIAEKYDHTNKWFGVVVELRGSKQVLNAGGGGLMFTVDGKQAMVSPTILAHSHPNPHCVLVVSCTITWSLVPKTQPEEAAVAAFVKTVANGHEVYATLLPGETGGGRRFSTKLTDQQLLAFHDTLQYYDSLAVTKKVSEQ
jgi:hypothetical protein